MPDAQVPPVTVNAPVPVTRFTTGAAVSLSGPAFAPVAVLVRVTVPFFASCVGRGSSQGRRGPGERRGCSGYCERQCVAGSARSGETQVSDPQRRRGVKCSGSR